MAATLFKLRSLLPGFGNSRYSPSVTTQMGALYRVKFASQFSRVPPDHSRFTIAGREAYYRR